MRQMGMKWQILIALLLSFLITGVYFLFLYEMLPFIYDINDDVAMRNVAAGVITGTPDAHLIFIKYILGLLISGLYKIFPGLDWYGLVLIGIMLLAFSMILYRGLVSEKSLLWKGGYTVIALLLFTCVGMQHITAFQWTVAAAMAGASGVYLFYTSETEERFQMVLEEGISVFLLLICLAVRESVFLMVIPTATACFWWKYGTFTRKKKIPVELKHLAVPIFLAVGFLLVMGLEKLAYRSQEWREFLAYNSDRVTIMDYHSLSDYDQNKDFYNSLEISPEEVDNLQRYSLYLVNDLYSDKIHKMAENVNEIYEKQNSISKRFLMGIKKVYEHWMNEDYAPLHIFSFCLTFGVLGIAWVSSKKQFALCVFCNSVQLLLWMYLGFRGRIVERVGYAMYLLTFLFMLAVGYRLLFIERKENTDRIWKGVLTAVSCLIFMIVAGIQWEIVKANNTWRRDYNLEFLDVNRYMAEHMENVYFMTTFSIETYTDNFTVRRDFAFSNLLSVGGWHTFSPLENMKIAKLGITDPKRDIVAKENVYVISLENVNLRYMDRYFESLYGKSYRGNELIDSLNYGERVFGVYDFTAEE